MSLLGTTIGRIRLVELAGKGGMGEVFVGYDETLGRKVAVKCVKTNERIQPHLAGRILREARILSRLAHPHICQIYDLVRGEDRDFLVLEWLEGRSLKLAIKEGLEPKAQQKIAQQLADVLVATHAEGVIHRDLKPDNVMITPEGDIKVLDFGVAHSHELEEDATVEVTPPSLRNASTITLPEDLGLGNGGVGSSESPTSKGQVVGTPRYMSPE